MSACRAPMTCRPLCWLVNDGRYFATLVCQIWVLYIFHKYLSCLSHMILLNWLAISMQQREGGDTDRPVFGNTVIAVFNVIFSVAAFVSHLQRSIDLSSEAIYSNGRQSKNTKKVHCQKKAVMWTKDLYLRSCHVWQKGFH